MEGIGAAAHGSTHGPHGRVIVATLALVLVSIGLMGGSKDVAPLRTSGTAAANGTGPLGSGPNTWTNVTPAVSPPPRAYHNLVYDGRADRFVLFGGQGVSAWLNDTWIYDLGNNTWTNVTPAVSPPARRMAAMAYDSDTDRVILFGGQPQDGFPPQTWAFDLAANRWTPLNASGYPPATHGATMSYDSGLHLTLLFGGGDLAPHFWDVSSGDLWAYNATANAWTDRLPGGAGVYGHGMVYDPRSGLTYVFGGCGWAPGDLCNDVDALRTYDSSTNRWTWLLPTGSPSPRQEFGIAFDPLWNRILVFGGMAAIPGQSPMPSNESVSYDISANAWYQMAPAVAPSARYGTGMAYDAVQDRFVLFGGSVSSDICCYDYPEGDTWVYESGPSSATIPGAPRNLGAAPNSGFIGLGWEPPAYDGGSPITNYNVYRSTASGGESLLGALGNVRAYVDTAVATGVIYYYQVSAINALGEGPRSNEASAEPATVPTAPQGLQASAGNSRVDLAWQPPLSNGGSPLLGYRIYRGTAAGGESPFMNLGVVSGLADTGVTPGVTYFYQVTAVNAVGAGPRSTEASATPSAPPGPPTEPRSLVAVGGDGTVTLTWVPPASDGGSPIVGYRIYRGTASGAESFLVSLGVVTSYVDAGLTNGIPYYYVVTAVNSVGESANSQEITAVPSAAPPPPARSDASAWIAVALAVIAASSVGYVVGRRRRRGPEDG